MSVEVASWLPSSSTALTERELAGVDDVNDRQRVIGGRGAVTRYIEIDGRGWMGDVERPGSERVQIVDDRQCVTGHDEAIAVGVEGVGRVSPIDRQHAAIFERLDEQPAGHSCCLCQSVV